VCVRVCTECVCESVCKRVRVCEAETERRLAKAATDSARVQRQRGGKNITEWMSDSPFSILRAPSRSQGIWLLPNLAVWPRRTEPGFPQLLA
jgi:hypothetical protein